MQKCFDYMATQFPGWEPSEGQLDTAILEAVSSEAADIASLTTQVPKSIFRYFGSTLMGITPQDATYATATSTWYMINTNGYIIPDGTQVTIVDDAGNLVPFVTLGDVQISAGSSNTATGGVTLVAVEAGVDSSGVGNPSDNVQLLDILPFVDHITLTTTSAGGLDAESDDDYLTRLSVELQLIAPRPIMARDFAIMARNADPVIQRATCIDGYNTADSTSNNQRMVTVVALDSTGAGVSSGVRTEIQNYLAGYREVNFVVNVGTPTFTNVDVTTNVLMVKGYSLNDVQYRVQTAIQNFLAPTTWGIDPSDDPNDPISWNNTTVVSYLELAAAISSVPGVAYVISLAIGLAGGAQSSADKTLTGYAPVPHVGTVVVNVSLS